MSADASWAAATNARPGCPTEWADLVAELDAENARLHGELIDMQCELATARRQLKRLGAVEKAVRTWWTSTGEELLQAGRDLRALLGLA